MNEVKLPFGKSAETGEMICIDAVERGLSCQCVCPQCNAALVAVHGDIYQHHFRHYVSAIGSCIGARETAIHLFAKQLISNAAIIRWPSGEHQLGPINEAEIEAQIHGLRPDVLLECGDEKVAVEIFVAHRVPPTKISIYAQEQLTAVEIDLGCYRHVAKTEEEWTKVILDLAPRVWLVPSKAMRAERERRAEEFIEQEREKERLAIARLDEINKRKLAAKTVLEQEAAISFERQCREEAARTQKILAAAISRATDLHTRAALVSARKRAMQPPSLLALIRAHGDYSKITPDAWRQFDTDMVAFRAFMIGGGLH